MLVPLALNKVKGPGLGGRQTWHCGDCDGLQVERMGGECDHRHGAGNLCKERAKIKTIHSLPSWK